MMAGFVDDLYSAMVMLVVRLQTERTDIRSSVSWEAGRPQMVSTERREQWEALVFIHQLACTRHLCPSTEVRQWRTSLIWVTGRHRTWCRLSLAFVWFRSRFRGDTMWISPWDFLCYVSLSS
jgi:hypothetical protein